MQRRRHRAAAGGVGAAVGIGAVVGFGSMVGVTAASFTSATTGFLGGATFGGASGAASGFVMETSNALLEGDSFGTALNKGIYGAASGGAFGTLTGGLSGGIQALQQGKNFWNGKSLKGSDISSGLKLNNEGGTNSVYRGRDSEKIVRYIGRTERLPEIRFSEHLHSGTDRALLDFEVIDGLSNLSTLDATIWEQVYINKYGMIKNGGTLFNLRNEISRKYWAKYGIKM